MSTLIARGPDSLRADLWRRAVDAVAWERVADRLDRPLDELVSPPGSFCLRLDAAAAAHAALAAARPALDRTEPWVLLLPLDQLPLDVLEGLAAEHAVLLLAPGTTPLGDRLVRAHPDHLEALLASVHLHTRDCLLAGPAAVGPLLRPARA